MRGCGCAAGINVDQYDHLTLVAGGIGVTPVASILAHLFNRVLAARAARQTLSLK